jgi:hypothetical protein
MNGRYGSPVEPLQPVGTELGDRFQAVPSLGAEPLDIDPEATRPVSLSLVDTVPQQGSRTAIVAVTQMVKANANLEDALVQVADGLSLGVPDLLQGVVAFVERSGVEELDTSQKAFRRILLTTGPSVDEGT